MARTQISRSQEQLTLEGARRATAACEKKALEIGVPMNIAVVDASLHLLSFTRMTDAKLTSIDISINKAFTAAGHKMPTHQYKGEIAMKLSNTNNGRFVTIGGGFPIKNIANQVIGAIGVSSGRPEEDEEVAKAGVDALNEILMNTFTTARPKL